MPPSLVLLSSDSFLGRKCLHGETDHECGVYNTQSEIYSALSNSGDIPKIKGSGAIQVFF